jgi:hypothetical protein
MDFRERAQSAMAAGTSTHDGADAATAKAEAVADEVRRPRDARPAS